MIIEFINDCSLLIILLLFLVAGIICDTWVNISSVIQDFQEILWNIISTIADVNICFMFVYQSSRVCEAFDSLSNDLMYKIYYKYDELNEWFITIYGTISCKNSSIWIIIIQQECIEIFFFICNNKSVIILLL